MLGSAINSSASLTGAGQSETAYAASNVNSYHDISSLQQLKAGDQKSPESLAEIGRQFESLLAHQMLKSMRSATKVWSEDSLFSSDQVDFYQQMMDDQMSLELTRGDGLGLAKQFVNDIATGAATDTKQDSSTATSALLPLEGRSRLQLKSGLINLQLKTQSADTQNSDEKVAAAKYASASVLGYENDQSSGQNFSSSQAFVNSMRNHANNAAQALGIEPEVLLAQAALESGWGNKTIKQADGSNSFNLFGIKADSSWQGDVAEVTTLEYFSDTPINVQAKFRSYNSYAESFSDYVNFIQSNSRYQNVAVKPQQYPQALQQAGYATDPHYAEKIESIMHRLNVNRLDTNAALKSTAQTEFKG